MHDCRERVSDHRHAKLVQESRTCPSGADTHIGGVLYIGAYSRFVTFLTATTYIFALCVSPVVVLE